MAFEFDAYANKSTDEMRASIRRKQERIEELEAALKPFARASDSYDAKEPAHVIAAEAGAILSVYDLRAAKAVLG